MSRKNKPLTNEIVDQRLIDSSKPITRIGDYIKSSMKIEWECNKCEYHWYTTSNSILNLNSGCPNCYGNVKYTNNDIDVKISSKPIVRIGDYKNYDKSIEWECTDCNNKWNASPNNVISGNTGCPNCSTTTRGLSKTEFSKPEMLKHLADKQITLLSEYTRIKDIHKLSCNVCDYVWETRLNDIKNNDCGCPSCAGSLQLTNDEVDRRLLERDDIITRVGEYVNAVTKIEWECKYGHLWEAAPDSVLNANVGCPTCNKRGIYNSKTFSRHPEIKTKPGTLYLIRFSYNNISYLKIGITSKSTQSRFGACTQFKVNVIMEQHLPLFEAWEVETEVIHKHASFQLIGPKNFGGRTECFIDCPEVEQSILKMITK